MIAKEDLQTFTESHRILLREKDFAYLLPHPALRGYISNYTVTFPSREIISDGYTVIPHGSATLVFSYDGSGFSSNLFGPLTKPCVVGTLANQYHMLLIIEFQPGGLSAFTGVNQKELANRTIPFDAVNPPLNRSMLEILERTAHLDSLIHRLDRCLSNHLHAVYPNELKTAINMIIQGSGNLSYKELSPFVYYSARHLNRIFETYLGMTQKTFSRLVRVNKAIRLMEDPRRSVTCASCEADFYDLSHFIHDFKAICGVTPQEYRNNVSDFYSEIAKF